MFSQTNFSRLPFIKPPIHSIKVGMTLVIDHSGKVFSKKKPTLKDLALNQEVLALSLSLKNVAKNVYVF